MILWIGPNRFPSRQAAVIFFQEILRKAELTDADETNLRHLLRLHPDARQKIGPGISHFTTLADGWGKKCFHVFRLDGTSTDFSYLVCIHGAPTHKYQVSQAFRMVVRWDILSLRDTYFEYLFDEPGKVACMISGKLLSKSEGHMDHRPPWTFDKIVREFLHYKKLELPEIELAPSQDNQIAYALANPTLGEEFRIYHNERANLLFVTKAINLSRR